jgi:hypothetical protein
MGDPKRFSLIELTDNSLWLLFNIYYKSIVRPLKYRTSFVVFNKEVIFLKNRSFVLKEVDSIAVTYLIFLLKNEMSICEGLVIGNSQQGSAPGPGRFVIYGGEAGQH